MSRARQATETRSTKETEVAVDRRDRRDRPGVGVDRAPVLRPHARAAGPPRRLRPHRRGKGRPRGRRPPHRGGRGHRPRRGAWPRRSGDKVGVRRFANALIPLDEALVEVALDLSGRPFLAYDVPFAPDTAGLGSPAVRPPARRGVLAGGRDRGRDHPARATPRGPQHPPHRGGRLQGGRPGRCATRCGWRETESPRPRDRCERGSPGTIAVLDYGIGNLASAHRALVHLGARARLVARPGRRRRRARGRASGGRGLRPLRRGARGERPRGGGPPGDRARACRSSGSASGSSSSTRGRRRLPGSAGLGALAGTVRGCRPGPSAPRSSGTRCAGCGTGPASILAGLPEAPWMYFVHSFVPPIGPETVAVCDYGGDMAAAIEAGPLWGTQFHPEKSGTLGLSVLANFVELADCPGRDGGRVMELYSRDRPARRTGGPAASRATSTRSAPSATRSSWPTASWPPGRPAFTSSTSTPPGPASPSTAP